MSIEVEGMDRLLRRLDALDQKVAAKIQRYAARETAKQIQRTAQNDAPVGETGALKASIKVRMMRARIGGKWRTLMGAKVMIDIRVLAKRGDAQRNYAAYQEYGTSRGVKPDRYLAGAAARHRNTAKTTFREATRAGIQEAVKTA